MLRKRMALNKSHELIYTRKNRASSTFSFYSRFRHILAFALRFMTCMIFLLFDVLYLLFGACVCA